MLTHPPPSGFSEIQIRPEVLSKWDPISYVVGRPGRALLKLPPYCWATANHLIHLQDTLAFLLASPPFNKLARVALIMRVGEIPAQEGHYFAFFIFLELFKLNLSVKIKLLLPCRAWQPTGSVRDTLPRTAKCPLLSSPAWQTLRGPGAGH